MKTIKEVRDYLKSEQAIAGDPGTPEWQVFTTLQNLAASCNSVDQFINQAHELSIDGPPEEVTEAREWLSIALDTIAGQDTSASEPSRYRTETQQGDIDQI